MTVLESTDEDDLIEREKVLLVLGPPLPRGRDCRRVRVTDGIYLVQWRDGDIVVVRSDHLDKTLRRLGRLKP